MAFGPRRGEKAVVAGFLFAATSAFAQTVPQNAERLMAAALNSPHAYETLEYLTDEIGPRLSGSAGAERAVQWTSERFRFWGIDARTEKVMVPHWVRGVERAELVSHHSQPIVLTALGGSVATPAAGITADVVELTSFDELRTTNVKGKIAFFNVPMDMDLVLAGRSFDAYGKAVEFRSRGADRAAEYGAVAVLIRSISSDSLRTPHTGSLRYSGSRKIPGAAMSAEDAMLVHRLLARKDRVRMHLVLTPKTLPDVESANVVAEIRGAEKPEEIVVIGAHLDSWDLGTGAIDDAGGVAMVMESLRLIKESGLKPKRTIRAVLFMNEENGLRGGRQYAADHRSEKHVAAIETDSGSAAPRGFLTTLKGDALAAFQKNVTMLDRVGAGKFETSAHTGADTSPLIDAGVTGFGMVPDARHYFDYHHSPADTLDKIDPHELAQNTASLVALAYVIADSDALK